MAHTLTHLAILAAGMLLAWCLGRRFERRQQAKLHALAAPILRLGVEAFNRADDIRERNARGARRTANKFDLGSSS